MTLTLFYLFLAHDAALVLDKQGVLQNTGLGMDDLISDVLDHYRLFINLEKMLKNPVQLAEQQIYQIDSDTQKMMIDRLVNQRHIKPIIYYILK